jgi:hypothetical protein
MPSPVKPKFDAFLSQYLVRSHKNPGAVSITIFFFYVFPVFQTNKTTRSNLVTCLLIKTVRRLDYYTFLLRFPVFQTNETTHLLLHAFSILRTYV